MMSMQDEQKFSQRFENEPKKLFKEKLNSGECSYKCEVLQKKIRSLTTKPGGDMSQSGNLSEQWPFERIVFTADEKAIRKFKRCREKSMAKIRQKNTEKPTRYVNTSNRKPKERESDGLS